MSDIEQDEQFRDDIRLTVTPEPTDEELLAILQALRSLEPDEVEPEEHGQTRSSWQEISRQEGLRARNWPAQVRSWADRRR